MSTGDGTFSLPASGPVRTVSNVAATMALNPQAVHYGDFNGDGRHRRGNGRHSTGGWAGPNDARISNRHVHLERRRIVPAGRRGAGTQRLRQRTA